MLSALTALAVLASAVAEDQPPLDFDAYCAAYGKRYDDAAERARRRAVYDERMAASAQLNTRPGATWTAGHGPLTDLSPEEMRCFFGYVGGRPGGPAGKGDAGGMAAVAGLPREVDWRLSAPQAVPPVRWQGRCGSCWAFSATATIESAVANATGVLPELSQQQITSCTPNPQHCGGGGGCAGATSQLAYAYAREHGVSSARAAPYVSGLTRGSGACGPAERYRPVAGITGFVQLARNQAAPLMAAVATEGLVSVSVDAAKWWMYARGIFDACDKASPTPNHAVTLLGYGEEAGVKYWLIQNSWGTAFGESGYIRLRRYDDEPCGVDRKPQQNTGCDGGPLEVVVCGECGILADSAYPTGAFLASTGGNRRLQSGLFV